ncbi:MAG: hypothetical protein CVV27_12275 [Candidatus Melainabacteria bacterium HGW-Melainabacteria-1]|nr:MAG: hypothetical protein CVV27_12275 [Candidatus Melainabacteria bacterium HGW-Melainabacteria-1]
MTESYELAQLSVRYQGVIRHNFPTIESYQAWLLPITDAVFSAIPPGEDHHPYLIELLREAYEALPKPVPELS